MRGTLETALWLARRPDCWAHAAELALRKLRPDRDGAEAVRAATEWAAARALPRVR